MQAVGKKAFLTLFVIKKRKKKHQQKQCKKKNKNKILSK